MYAKFPEKLIFRKFPPDKYKIFQNFVRVQEFARLKIRLAHFRLIFPFYIPWTHQRSSGFLMFLGGITKESWSEMGLTLRTFNIYQSVSVGHYSFSTYPKVSEKLKFLTPWRANQGVRNVSFRKILRTNYMNDS